MPSTFGLPVDDFRTTTTGHAEGADTLALAAGAGDRLPELPANRVYRVTAVTSPDTPEEAILAVLEASGLSGDTLTGVTASAGYTNVALPASTTIDVRMTAKHLAEVQDVTNANEAAIAAHVASTSNPHGVTKSQVGLGGADNTSDASKPISAATAAALAGKAGTFALDVRTYGAVGDGTHDDTAAVQAAVDAAVAGSIPVFFPPGNWLVDGLVAAGRVDVVGAGPGATVIRCNGGTTSPPILTVAVAPSTIPLAAAIGASTLTHSADFGSSGQSADARPLSLTHARALKDSLDGLGDFTIEFVASSTSATQSTWIAIADVGLDGNPSGLERLTLSDAGGHYTLKLRLKQDDGSYVTATFDTSPTAPSTSAAEHVAFVRSGTTLKSFVAGVLKNTYTGVVGTLEVKPLDEFTLFGSSGVPFFSVGGICWAKVDSIRIGDTALFSATFAPPATVPQSPGGTTLLWWNADRPQVAGTTPILPASVAVFEDAYALTSQSCGGSTFRDFTIAGGSIGLFLSGAPGCRLDRVDSANCQVPIWLQDNCYHTSIRDSVLSGCEIGVIARSASGDLSLDNIHAAFAGTAGFVVVNAQEQVSHHRCHVDGEYVAAFVAARSDTVVYSACSSGEEGRDPALPLAASWVLQDNVRVAIRDSSHGGGVAPVPGILAASSDAANGHLRIEGCQFWMHADAAAVIAFVGTQPAAVSRVWGCNKSEPGVPWVDPAQDGYVDIDLAGVASGVAIGDAVGSGTATYVLHLGASGVLAQSVRFTYDGSTVRTRANGSANQQEWGDASGALISSISSAGTPDFRGAFGSGSQAVGASSTATGLFSHAFGYGSTSSGTGTTAFGAIATASADGATAFGAFATAGGNNSMAIGRSSTATHTNAFATGNGTASTVEHEFRYGTALASAAPTLALAGASTTTGNLDTFDIVTEWTDATHVSRKTRAKFLVFDAAGAREGLRLESDGAQALLSLGGGAQFKSVLSAVATLDFPSVEAGAQAELTLSVTGGAVGDTVHLGRPATLESGLVATARVTSADTVTVRVSNVTALPIDPASASYRATIFKF